MQERLHTAEATAQMLSLSRTKVFEEIKEGRLKSVKIGRARRIPQSEIEAFIRMLLEEQTVIEGDHVAQS